MGVVGTAANRAACRATATFAHTAPLRKEDKAHLKVDTVLHPCPRLVGRERAGPSCLLSPRPLPPLCTHLCAGYSLHNRTWRLWPHVTGVATQLQACRNEELPIFQGQLIWGLCEIL